MKSLSDLNEDLLYLIALHFERDRGTLYALTLVCRDFHDATKFLLYRHIGNLSREKIFLLEQRFTNDPSLKLQVQSCTVDLDRGVPQHDGLRHALSYPNLKEIAFNSYDKSKRIDQYTDSYEHYRRLSRIRMGRDVTLQFQCAFLNEYRFPGIQTIRLIGDFTTAEILRFMFLPDVKTVHAEDIGALRAPGWAARFSAQTSLLTSLSLTGGVLWSSVPEHLHSIIAACPLLQNLTCQIPMVTELTDSMSFLSSKVTEPVSPVALNAVFEPVRETLRYFSLLQIRHNVPYDGSHMDLSGFKALEELQITSCCLLPPVQPCIARDELCQLLPPSLQRLKIDFPRESSIFYHHEEGAPFLCQDITAIPQARYSWISQLLRNKAAHFPALMSAKMRDPPGSVGYWRWRQAEWEPPEEITNLARETGVKLDVLISYPHPESEMDSWDAREHKPGKRQFEWEE